MIKTSTQNSWTVDLDKYEPVLLDPTKVVTLRAGFSLSEEKEDYGKRLRQLVDFIHQARFYAESANLVVTPHLSITVSQNVVEQIIYLAYWKNYRLEFHIGKAGDHVAIWARFLNKPELNCMLDQFEDGEDNQNALQGWLDFLCNIISDHADIWQIYLAVQDSSYDQLTVPTSTRVFIEVESDEGQLAQTGLPALPVSIC
jgi:hypothetical protein